ncbi:MAG: UbiA-like polyprenyltransferase [Bacteroidota bacterium]
MLKTFKNYLSFIKFSHTVFALPFAAIGFTAGIVIGKGVFSFDLAVKVLLCMVFARSAAMGFNRWADRHIDAKNPRTKEREIPAGKISSNAALAFIIVNCLGFIITTRFINELCFYLSFVALAVVLGYSYMKRITPLCHIVLGLGLALAPLGAWLAVTGVFNLLPILFSVAVLTWVGGFDIIYALQDIEFDQAHQLKSIPSYFGLYNSLIISRVLHFITGLTLLAAGYYGGFSFIYFIGMAIFCALLIYQHTLVKANDLSRINFAFFNTNGLASITFSVFVIVSLLL